MSFSSDWLFPPEQSREIVSAVAETELRLLLEEVLERMPQVDLPAAAESWYLHDMRAGNYTEALKHVEPDRTGPLSSSGFWRPMSLLAGFAHEQLGSLPTEIDRLRRRCREEDAPVAALWTLSLLDAPAEQRQEVLSTVVPADQRVHRRICQTPPEAEAFLRAAIAAGHEGIMAKAPGATYQAGSRGAEWLKIKPTHTLDLVVLAAEWGSGRRQGKLSNLHLGARDPRDDTYVMLGKTFKGLTDEMLSWQTEALLERRAEPWETQLQRMLSELKED